MTDGIESSGEQGHDRWIIHGNIVVPTGNPFTTQPQETKEVESLALGPGVIVKLNHVLTVGADGIITRLESARIFFENNEKSVVEEHEGYVLLKEHEFACPGLIDLHIHAPQYAFAGTATDRPLMGSNGWLETYTFPTEESFRDLSFAQQVYTGVVKKTLQMGTTTALYFATLDLEPTKLLVDIALQFGQRALVGKVCMDRNSPETYCQSLDKNLQDTRNLIEYIGSHPAQASREFPLVLPVITPRFIPTCSPELLQGLADIALEHNCHITSHISESIDEVEFSRQLDIENHGTAGRSDAEIFLSHGLLTDKCVMAHGVHLSDADLRLMKEKGSSIAHCPLSNFFFAGGCLRCRKIMERGVKIGLGTDIAGGYSPSVMDSARNTVVASLSLQQQEPSESHTLDYLHSFYLATLGGAEALGLEDRIGTFSVGMEFDAFILSGSNSSPDIYPRDTLADIFQKLCILGDDRNVSRVFVRGRQVVPLNNQSKQTGI
jgi:guanine deaminase